VQPTNAGLYGPSDTDSLGLRDTHDWIKATIGTCQMGMPNGPLVGYDRERLAAEGSKTYHGVEKWG
jgi:hypothetical protein